MNRLYKKSRLTFAIVWIIIYVAGMSLSGSVSDSLGAEGSVSLVIAAVMSLVLLQWVRKNRLENRFGLCISQKKASDLLFFLPLIIVVGTRMTGGFSVQNAAEALTQFVFMLFVGFLEEMIFRGFLFKAMAEDGVKSAVIVSAVTFGIGHLVNLVNGSGQDLTSTIWQIVLAVIFGFCMVFVFYYCGSLWPCIITHGLYNALGMVTQENSIKDGHVTAVFVIQLILMAGYALYLLSRLRKENKLQDRSN